MPTANVPIPVPVSGFGSAVDVSALVGEKTVILSGRYQGAYVLYGSHDGSNFAPLLIFNAGGIESIKQTFSGALSQVKLKSLASNASGVSANISGLSVPLDNSFTSIGPVGKGLSSAVDLGNSAYQTDLNFMGFGRLNGVVVVEGSSDGMGFNPIGEFSAAPSGTSLLGGGGIEFSPLGTKDKVRYVRLNVLGDVPNSFLVTIGGAQSDSGGGGGETLADAYLAGVTSVDQTLLISDANGGKVVFDATGAGFTGHEAVAILGIGRGFYAQYGSLTLGPNNLGIGIAGMSGSYYTSDAPADFYNPTSVGNIAIGPYVAIDAGDYSVAVGSVACYDSNAVAMGSGATVAALQSVAIGWDTSASSNGVAIGPMAHASDDSAVAIGNTVQAGGYYATAVGAGSSALEVGSVAIGASSVLGEYSVGIGYDAKTGTGSWNIAVGYISGVNGIGSVNTCVGFAAVVGDPVSETRDFHNNVRVGSGNGVYASFSVGIGNNVVVGSTFDLSPIEGCVAIGEWAAVTGSYGIAFGYGAKARTNEATFGDDNPSGGACVSRFHATSNVGVNNSGSFVSAADSVFNPGIATTLTSFTNLPVNLRDRQYVTITGSAHYNGSWITNNVDLVNKTFDIYAAFAGNDAGNWSNVTSADLFGFDRSLLVGADTTVMTLLIEKHGGGVVAVPVTLSAPVSGHSYLQVANS